MTEPLKVLVWGNAVEGPCAYFRGYLFDEPLKQLGIEQRHISNVKFRQKAGFTGTLEEAFATNQIELDTTDIDWADVIVFRRYYNTAYRCAITPEADFYGTEFGNKVCTFLTIDPAEAAQHQHGFRSQDDITRVIWPAIRDMFSGAIVYETDDNHWQIKPWNGYYPDVVLERDLISEMAQRADLITVATPALVPWYGRFNDGRIRVVRNAVDPDLYVRDKPRGTYEKPRLVYYGSTARLRDYAGFPNERGKHEGGYARAAVEENRHRLTTVFLGTNVGTEALIARMFDEQSAYVIGIAAFSKSLVESDGDIGIAPLGGDEFDRCKSELHWLEYSLADMAFIGERFNGRNGPYNVIDHGKDGLLARGRGEWADAVGRLATSQAFREELAGRAKERVLREYDYRVRAQEWADAFRWAAEHVGIGRGSTQVPVAA